LNDHLIELVTGGIIVAFMLLREFDLVPRILRKSQHSYTVSDRKRDYEMHNVVCGDKALGVDNINKILSDIRDRLPEV
jgi:hypothetical protein